jgi:hypothetical protein
LTKESARLTRSAAARARSDATVGGRVGSKVAKGVNTTIKGVKSAAASVSNTSKKVATSVSNTSKKVAAGTVKAATATKKAVTDTHKSLARNNSEGYKNLGYGSAIGAGIVGSGMSAWSAHKRNQRGY